MQIFTNKYSNIFWYACHTSAYAKFIYFVLSLWVCIKSTYVIRFVPRLSPKTESYELNLSCVFFSPRIHMSLNTTAASNTMHLYWYPQNPLIPPESRKYWQRSWSETMFRNLHYVSQTTLRRTPGMMRNITQIAKFMGPTWGPPGSCRPQMGPMLASRTLLSGSHPVR